MPDHDTAANQFETHRGHLRAVAYRMLGSTADVDDVVQEAWLRFSRADIASIENLRGWLTTVVGRLCLDILRARKSSGETAIGAPDGSTDAEPVLRAQEDPEQEAVLADSVGIALLVVLETLTPAERLAFVLHDLFAVSFDEIATIVGRTPAAARQLASRARRRVRGAAPTPSARLSQHRGIVKAFLTALRAGDFEGLLAVLDPDVVVRADRPGMAGAPVEIRGARTWAQSAVAYAAMARVAQLALVDGAPGIVVAAGGRVTRALIFTIAAGKIADVQIISEPERLGGMAITTVEE